MWKPIETAPKDDETQIVIGNYYIDECNGYYGPSRWRWITSGTFSPNGDFWEDFNDEEILAKSMRNAREATHWMPLPAPPDDE